MFEEWQASEEGLAGDALGEGLGELKVQFEGCAEDRFEGLIFFLRKPKHDVVGLEGFLKARERREEGLENLGFHSRIDAVQDMGLNERQR